MTRLAAWIGATAAVLTGRKRIFYGWWILASCAAGLGLVNGMSFWSFGLFIQPVEDEFGWSRADVSLGVSISLLVAGLTAPLIGQLVDRRGPRIAIVIGAVCTAATYVLLATTETLWQWNLYMALNGLARHLIFLIPFMALTSRWFDRRRSLAVGISGSGLMAGGMIMVPVMRFAIDRLDWDGAFLFIALLTVLIYIPLAVFVIRDNPSDMGESADGDASTERTDGGQPVMMGLTLAESMRTALFWIFLVALMLFTAGMTTWIVHAVPFYESVGLSPAWAAALTSLTAGIGIFTRLAAGHLADRLPRLEYGATGVALLIAIALLVLLVSTSPIAITVFLVLFTIGFGGGGALMVTLLLTRGFGVAHFGTIMGAVMIAESVGMLVGPTAAGAIFDSTGSYTWALVMLLGTFAVAAALFWLSSRIRHPLEALPGAAPSATRRLAESSPD